MEENKVFNSGFKESILDGSEHIFGISTGMSLPEEYTYREYLPKVLNQGSDPICVPCSISAYLNWRENLKDGSKKDNKIKYFDIYDSKTTDGEGMSFKEAFKYVRHNGVRSNAGVLKINGYAMIKSTQAMRQAIVMNGPCVAALPVYNFDDEFWNKTGAGFYGYHAISMVGFNKDGFYIRNSWGTSFADNGYTFLKNEDFKKIVEAWTVVE